MPDRNADVLKGWLMRTKEGSGNILLGMRLEICVWQC